MGRRVAENETPPPSTTLLPNLSLSCIEKEMIVPATPPPAGLLYIRVSPGETGPGETIMEAGEPLTVLPEMETLMLKEPAVGSVPFCHEIM
jgi:hypothetical protein